MRSAIALFAILGLAAAQAQAAPVAAEGSLSGVPMSVAKRLNRSPELATSSMAARLSSLPMRQATRQSALANAAPEPYVAATTVALSGVRQCHAKRT